MNAEGRTYIEWLNSQISMEKTYRHHKETMAWLATALYLTTFIGLGIFINTNDLSCTFKVVITLWSKWEVQTRKAFIVD